MGLIEQGILTEDPCPFPILVGTSAGSINATALAAYADDFLSGIEELNEVWTNIHSRHVFRTDFRATCNLTYRWVRDLGFGGLLGGVMPKSLLDTTPLPRLLSRIPFHRIDLNIESGHIAGLAVAATEYFSNDSVIFLQGKESLPSWNKKRARVQKTRIGLPHLLASSAIPMIFPTVEVNGNHFGDGCLRNTTPLGPAIRLGADKILAVGVHEPSGTAECRAPMVADVASTILGAIMMDAMEKDVAHCQRINKNLNGHSNDDFRKVEVLWLAPSRPIAPLAKEMMSRIPTQIRYLIRGLGGDHAAAELASYLLFHPDFCTLLLTLGRLDVLKRKDEIESFLFG